MLLVSDLGLNPGEPCTQGMSGSNRTAVSGFRMPVFILLAIQSPFNSICTSGCLTVIEVPPSRQ